MKTKTIALIGMTGSGKTKVGEELARQLECNLLDLDQVIVEREGSSIPEIFSDKGEEYFRQCEHDALNDTLYMKKNIVLSCGGGVIIAERNRQLLRENSIVVWITRDVELVLQNETIIARPPINGDKSRYLDLLLLRQPLYQDTAHFVVENRDVEDCVDEIIKLLALCE